MSSWRKCVFGCEDYTSLYNLPKEEATREAWLDFIYGNPKQQNFTKNLFVCDRHFEEDCLMNKSMYESGLCNRLTLRSGSIPTMYINVQPRSNLSVELLDLPEEKPSISSIDLSQPAGHPVYSPSLTPSLSSFPVMLISGKKDPPFRSQRSATRSVATQLSANTLKNIRSKAVQASNTFHTVNVGVQTVKRKITLPLARAFLVQSRPKKRPRVEMEEERVEEEQDEDEPVFDDSSHRTSVYNFTELTDTDLTPDYEDTKYIVFEKNLRQLFEQCPVCNSECAVQRQRCGTFVSFTQHCPECMYSRTWQNQPVTRSTPVGDLQLSASVYFSGGSFQKMQRICKGINLQIHQLDTFKKHSRMFLEPTICHNWKLHQERVFDECREHLELPVAGDMRAHPPGPSAKLGSYTTMDLESKKILDIQLVQSKKVGDKNLMEKRGLKRSLDRLEANNLKVDYIVTDRHAKVQKYLQNRQITQYYDVWRLEKDLSKKLDALSEKKDFEVLKKWSPAIKHHMYWAAASSSSGEEKVAKWISQINHLQDIHKHDDPVFPQCAHPDKKTRNPDKWFKPDTKPLHEVEKLLLDKRVLRDVPKLCSNHQTSSLDLFHKLSVRFKPEDVTFSLIETKCRLFLAAMHFNENTAPDQEMTGNDFLFVKSKQACPNVKTKATYGYVRDLMELLFTQVLHYPSAFDLKNKTETEHSENHEMMEEQHGF
ncbi:hypothetical protein NL108_012054 [Boleophthalmus pectinirostris]|uniref:uncharacterized protein LOC110158814 isoform X2 n=1 Tax=Boleophthalmus pectinirostris TaxID=150288 RepID=UPI000A1C5766|nr:uncharacterized protein LOC110158814 isoform X2 [Boleophthalmus pectinirostris]KAJ0056673.1 hypothetical protein NL108_012054 [Boleophthalmus pectinirostris]